MLYSSTTRAQCVDRKCIWAHTHTHPCSSIQGSLHCVALATPSPRHPGEHTREQKTFLIDPALFIHCSPFSTSSGALLSIQRFLRFSLFSGFIAQLATLSNFYFGQEQWMDSQRMALIILVQLIVCRLFSQQQSCWICWLQECEMLGSALGVTLNRTMCSACHCSSFCAPGLGAVLL